MRGKKASLRWRFFQPILKEEIIKAFIRTHFDRCTGCSICQLSCSMDLLGGYNPRRARLIIRHQRENLYHLPVVCNQCDNAYCMNVCPARAITKDEDGIVCIDARRCIGCGLCVEYCPIDMVQLDPDTQKAVKCELCQGSPLCVAACPVDALELVRLRENPVRENQIEEDQEGGNQG